MEADLEATTLASLFGTSRTLMNDLIDGNLSNVKEEDELKLLNFPSKREDLSTAIPLTVIFALLLVTGCIGNMCTAIVIARPKNKYMHTATNYYLFSLAMSDFLFLILGLPQEMYTLWQRYPYAFGESFCIMRGYLSEASTYASILTISAFTIERYVAICHPLWAHTMSQLPRAITSIVIIWILAAICAIPPAAELGIIHQKGPLSNRTLEQSAQCATKRTIYENMFVVSAIVFFIVPMIIVTVLYILIAIELRRSSRMNSAISKQTSSHLNSNGHSHSKLWAGQNHRCCAHNNLVESCCHNGARHQHPHHHHQNKSTTGNQLEQRHGQLQLQHQQQRQGLFGADLCGHMRRTSKSQQQITCTISPSSSLGFSKTQQQQQQQQASLANAGSGSAENNNQSLMADIMSQRPSSAIGNEQQQLQTIGDGVPCGCDCCSCCCCCRNLNYCCRGAGELRKQRSLASSLARLASGVPAAGKRTLSFWPLFLTSSGHNTSQLSQAMANCQCAGNMAANPSGLQLGPSASVGCNTARTGNSLALEQSQSNQFPASSMRNDSPESQLMNSASNNRALHSPLSYHESLIQRGHQTSIANSASGNSTAALSAGCQLHNGVLRPVQAHQLSLSHLSSYCQNSNSVRNLVNQSSSCSLTRPLNQNQNRHHHHIYSHQHQHQPHHHHHPHNHHHHHQQQQHTTSQSRRSAAASSKKSVIRMLVAVVVSFFICWVPFHAQRLLASYLAKDENQNQLLLDIYLKLTYISGVMYYLSSTINPLLYQLMSAKFRLAFKETFNCSLFKCAIFGKAHRTSGCSPTNSLRENNNNNNNTNCHHHHPHHHHHHPHHQNDNHKCACKAHKPLQHLDSKSSHIGANSQFSAPAVVTSCSRHLVTDINTANAIDPNSQQDEFSSRCLAHGHDHNLPFQCPQHLGTVARLKSRLNSSLVSLFRLNSNCDTSSLTNNGSGVCACCGRHAYQHLATEGPTITDGGGELVGRCVTPSRHAARAQHSAINCGQAHCGIKQSTSCALTPLLGDPEQNKATCGQQQTGRLTAHSMLKFIKSPTPICAAGQPSLTRLSSREEDEQASSRRNSYMDLQQNGTKSLDGERDASECIDQRLAEDERRMLKQKVDCERMDELIRATQQMESDEANQEAELLQVRSLTVTSESGQSSGSSPDAGQQVIISSDGLKLDQCPRGHQMASTLLPNSEHRRQKKVSSGSSNASGGNATAQDEPLKRIRKVDAKKRRRNSLQASHKHNNGFATLQANNKLKASQERRKSSSSSNKQNFSSSFSSFDRHLDKRVSLSTTTSAIYDCGGSFTTTNSQLTTGGCDIGSNSNLFSVCCEEKSERDFNRSLNKACSSSGIDEDPTTVMNVATLKLDQLELEQHHQDEDQDEISRPLLGANEQSAVAATTTTIEQLHHLRSSNTNHVRHVDSF